MIPGLRPALFSGGGSSPYTSLNPLTAGSQGSISGDLFTVVANGVVYAATPFVGPLRTTGRWQFELEYQRSSPLPYIGGGIYVPPEGSLPENSTLSYADGTWTQINASGQNGFFPPANPVEGGRTVFLLDLVAAQPLFFASGTGVFGNSRAFRRAAAGHGPCAFINTTGAPVGWQGSVRFIGRRADMRFPLATNYQPWDDT